MNHSLSVSTECTLAAGEHLSRDEFERRYAAMPEEVKAELIEGVVTMPSPVRVVHSRPHAHMVAWLSIYWFATDGIDLQIETTVRLDASNEVQPDVFLRLEQDRGGRSRIDADNYLEGAPELVVEIAASSASYDLHEKLAVYGRCGVQEYIVWQTETARLDWFALRERTTYRPLLPGKDGIIRSEIFPGLFLAIDALLNGDRAGVLSAAQYGLTTPEYAAFVHSLR